MSRKRNQRPANVAYYRRNRDLEWRRIRVRQAGTVEMLRELRQVPCADCGGHFEPYQMDFDHRDPSTKSFNLMTGRAMLMSTRKLMAEVAKRDVVATRCERGTCAQPFARSEGSPVLQGAYLSSEPGGARRPHCSRAFAMSHAQTVAADFQAVQWNLTIAIQLPKYQELLE